MGQNNIEIPKRGRGRPRKPKEDKPKIVKPLGMPYIYIYMNGPISNKSSYVSDYNRKHYV